MISKFKNSLKKTLQNESGQGATEYILMLVIVVAIAVAFGPQIKRIIADKANAVGGQISGFDPNK